MKKNEKNKCLVISTVDKDHSGETNIAATILKYVVEPIVKGFNHEVIDAQLLNDPGDRYVNLIRYLIEAPMVIVILTDCNPDVYYQMAIRHTYRKPSITIACKKLENQLPSMIDSNNTIFVDIKSPESNDSAKSKLKDQFKSKDFPTRLSKTIEGYHLQIKAPQVAELFDRLGEDMNKRMGELQNLIGQIALIADNTRKPLTGIVEIIYELYLLLKNAKKGGSVWFLGMTLGFGPPHKFRRVDENNISEQLKKLNPGLPDFDNIIIEINEMLKEILYASPNSTIVCLKQDQNTLKKKFLNPLSERKFYEKLKGNIDSTAKDVIDLHESVELKVNQNKPVKYLDSIPLQLIAVDREDGGQECLVFHVGTENIHATKLDRNGELGFCSRIGGVIAMFTTVAETYYEDASA